jgi:hypothetical protein
VTAPLTLAKELIEKAGEATAGPWEQVLWIEDDKTKKQVHAVIEKQNDDKVSFEIVCYKDGPTSKSLEFIAFARNHAPEIAKALVIAVEKIQRIAEICDDTDEFNGARIAREALEQMGEIK